MIIVLIEIKKNTTKEWFKMYIVDVYLEREVSYL